MMRMILYLVLCIIFAKFSFGRKNYFAFADSIATQDSMEMNNISYGPLNSKITSSHSYIWPNPTRDKITVYVNSLGENEQGECVVYNNNGTPVLMDPVRDRTNEIILGSIPDGIYVVAITNKKK